MRIVFSRKGFDSQYGGVPSPILPDGSLVSLPIPSRYGRPLQELSFRGTSLAEIVADLKGDVGSVHLDPDLDPECAPRLPGWRPAFGQVASAQSHLTKEGVGLGDVFLFFGWFRQVEKHAGRWRYVRGAPNIHSLFGWLQVGEIVPVPVDSASSVARRLPWLADHPHIAHAADIGRQNTIYIGAERLWLGDDAAIAAAGGGAFCRWSAALQLTEAGRTRSKWLLPGWMMPGPGMRAMSLHGAAYRWERTGEQVRLQTVGKGQEFVLDVGQHTEQAHAWLKHLIAAHGAKEHPQATETKQ